MPTGPTTRAAVVAVAAEVIGSLELVCPLTAIVLSRVSSATMSYRECGRHVKGHNAVTIIVMLTSHPHRVHHAPYLLLL